MTTMQFMLYKLLLLQNKKCFHIKKKKLSINTQSHEAKWNQVYMIQVKTILKEIQCYLR